MPVSQAYKIFSGQFLRLLVSCIRQSRLCEQIIRTIFPNSVSHSALVCWNKFIKPAPIPSAKKSTRSTKL